MTWPEEEHSVREQKIRFHKVTALTVQVFSAVSSGGESRFFFMSVTTEGLLTELG